MEALAGPLVAAIIGGATLLIAFRNTSAAATKADITDVRAQLIVMRNQLALCEAAREALSTENINLMRQLVAQRGNQ